MVPEPPLREVVARGVLGDGLRTHDQAARNRRQLGQEGGVGGAQVEPHRHGIGRLDARDNRLEGIGEPAIDLDQPLERDLDGLRRERGAVMEPHPGAQRQRPLADVRGGGPGGGEPGDDPGSAPVERDQGLVHPAGDAHRVVVHDLRVEGLDAGILRDHQRVARRDDLSRPDQPFELRAANAQRGAGKAHPAEQFPPGQPPVVRVPVHALPSSEATWMTGRPSDSLAKMAARMSRTRRAAERAVTSAQS